MQLADPPAEPGEHLFGVLIWREDRVEDALDDAIGDDQCEAFVEPLFGDGKCRQGQRVGDHKAWVR